MNYEIKFFFMSEGFSVITSFDKKNLDEDVGSETTLSVYYTRVKRNLYIPKTVESDTVIDSTIITERTYCRYQHSNKIFTINVISLFLTLI